MVPRASAFFAGLRSMRMVRRRQATGSTRALRRRCRSRLGIRREPSEKASCGLKRSHPFADMPANIGASGRRHESEGGS